MPAIVSQARLFIVYRKRRLVTWTDFLLAAPGMLMQLIRRQLFEGAN